ncbi:MAG: hypothetical protein AAF632_29755, partial [Bacteroidota bacterium]
LRLTYEEDESPLRVSREEENVSVEWQVWVNVKPAKKVKEAVDQENGGFRQVTGMVLLNGNNQAAFTYNVNDGSGRYVVQEGGVSIAYDYDPNTEAKTNPQILSKPLDLSRFDRTSGTRYPNFLVETFKWSDLQGAFGKYTHQVWDGFVNGQGQVWELPSTYGVRNGALYDITTYRFITSINFRGSNFTFKIDVEDYTPR